MKNIIQLNNRKTRILKFWPIAAFVLCINVFTSCVEDDLAYDIIESPVLAVFDSPSITDDVLTLTGTFYELDKSGILDSSIGIDSTLISGMTLSVYVYGDVLVETLTTDANGVAMLSTGVSNLDGAGTLEWVGVYNNVPFRILKKY